MVENKKVWEYRVDESKGLSKRLILNTVVIQEETEVNKYPEVVVHLFEEEYVTSTGARTENGFKSISYVIKKGTKSYNIDREPLPKRIIDENGQLQPVFEEDGITPVHRDNGYENIIELMKKGVDPYTILDTGVPEYFKIV